MRDVVPQNIVHAFIVVVGPVAERCKLKQISVPSHVHGYPVFRSTKTTDI